jgi:Tetratricopeptide repeat
MRVMGPTVEGLLLAERGELDEAVTLARTGVATAESEIDSPWFQGWAYEDLVTVLIRAGRIGEAREALERLLGCASGCASARRVGAGTGWTDLLWLRESARLADDVAGDESRRFGVIVGRPRAVRPEPVV